MPCDSVANQYAVKVCAVVLLRFGGLVSVTVFMLTIAVFLCSSTWATRASRSRIDWQFEFATQ